MHESTADDPAIPFRVSHAVTIAETKTTVALMLRIGAALGGVTVTVLCAILTVLLMNGR